MEIKNLNKTELKSLLKDLILYRDLSKKLGKRGKEFFMNNINNNNKLVVEYFSTVGEELAYKTSLSIYNKFFNIKPEKNEIIFIPRDYLNGGIKVYKNDLLVDLSFSKVENLFK